MAIVGFEITWEQRGAYKRFFGHVTDDELMRSVHEIESDERFDALRYVICDFLGIDTFDVTEDNVRIISAIDAAAAMTNPHIKIAVVATDARVHGLAEVYATAPWTAYETGIFRHLAEARAWI